MANDVGPRIATSKPGGGHLLQQDGRSRTLPAGSSPAAVATAVAEFFRYSDAERRAAVDEQAAAAFLRGYAPSHAAFTAQRLQCRDADDRTNWLGASKKYEAAVAAGAGATIGAKFRTAANITVTVSYTDGVAVLNGLLAWADQIMNHAWELKDAIATGGTPDITAGWPA